uniref:BclA C-terminal domain-containing protein n=1 Tax=Clostridium sp. 12(A) TaxID=1163671 RepID=UPI00336A9A64
MAFGGAFNNTAQTIPISAGDTEPVALSSSTSTSRMAPSTNSITVTESGNYFVEFMVSLLSTTGDFDLNVGVQVNGVFTEPSLLIGTTVSTEAKTITGSSIVPLNTGDVLTLAVNSTAGGTVEFGANKNAQIQIIQLN